MKKSIKNIVTLILSFLVVFTIGSHLCLAAGSFNTSLLDDIPVGDDSSKKVADIATSSGYSTSTTATDIFSRVIQIVLGLSGTVALALVIISGIQYLLSKGDPGKIKKALAYMSTGFIGILLMTSAYALSGYIIKQTRRISGIGDAVSTSTITQSDIDKCAKLGGLVTCNANSSCVYFDGTCIVKGSLEGGHSCTEDGQCSTGTCYNNFCLIKAGSQETGCLLSSYSTMSSYTKASLINALKNNTAETSSSLCKTGYTASSVSNANDGSCALPEETSKTGYTLKGVEYVCGNGSSSDSCFVCLKRECSEVILSTTCGSATAYNGAYVNCKWANDGSTGTSHCVDK